eukprot:SAG11_NODE_7930_length_1080_cov_0.780836_3_plen_74_part_00
MVPRFEDCIDEEMVEKITELMADKMLIDSGTMLVQLAAVRQIDGAANTRFSLVVTFSRCDTLWLTSVRTVPFA